MPERQPHAQTALVLGIVGVAGFFTLVLPVLVSPYAWYHAAVARREIEREPGRWSGAGAAKAGLVLGVIGTSLLALSLALLTLVTLGIVVLTRFDGGY